MGSDWDDSGEEDAVPKPAAVAAPKKSKFADEDASDDDVKDDWDASDDEDKPAAAKPTGPPPPVRQKGITKQKIAEKEAAERAKAAELAARKDDDPAARRAREREAMLKADMANAADLFGGLSTGPGGAEDPFSMKCTIGSDFDELATVVADRLISKHGDHPLYASFVEKLVKEICGPLKDIETRKAASALTTLANEKQKAAKDAAGGKKKKGASKPALGAGKTVAAGRADTRVYEDALDDDYDDFM
ncbi:translation initiation factor eIF3 subunit [Meredithblackwellia eburnea MCA 4105]